MLGHAVTSRLLFLAGVGALQGAGFWWLVRAAEFRHWPSTAPVAERAFIYLLLAVPAAIYLCERVADRVRTVRLAVLAAIVFGALGAYAGWSDDATVTALNERFAGPETTLAQLLPAAVLGLAGVTLLLARERGQRDWSYARVFDLAWRNAILVAATGALAGLFWVVVLAGVLLLRSIGVTWPGDVLGRPGVFLPLTGLVVGVLAGMVAARDDMLVTLRSFCMSLTAWFLPLALLFGVVWVALLPFTGVAPLFATKFAGFVLLWFTALAILFANAAYQGGTAGAPFPRWLARATAWAWLALPVVVVVAAWAIGLRVQQYGWTVDRVWAVFVLVIAAGFVFGYAASLRRRGDWMASIGRTNIAMAFVLCAGLLLLLSPVADVRRLAVHDQVGRLLDGRTRVQEFDFHYLRWHAGRHGVAALEQLGAGSAHAEAARIAELARHQLARKTQRDGAPPPVQVAEMARLIAVLPRNTPIPPGLLERFSALDADWRDRQCQKAADRCTLWLVDLDGDGRDEAVLLRAEAGGTLSATTVYAQRGPRWDYVGQLSRQVIAHDALVEEIASGRVQLVAPAWKDIVVRERRRQVLVE